VLSRNLIELHGGTLDATSVPGEGSRFTITLPWRLGPARPAERGDLAA
jgi:signal transduction histidine kinase